MASWPGSVVTVSGSEAVLGGVVVRNVHDPDRCAGRVCVLHNPTDHHMRGWPIVWRASRIVERVCEHGTGHPDPDQFPFWEAVGGSSYLATRATHGCDGCCHDGSGPVVWSGQEETG